MPPASVQPDLGHVNVVGGCGFLGHHIVRHIIERYPKTRISVLDLKTNRNRVEKDSVSYHDCDITDEAAVDALYSELKPDVVIHTASPVFVGSNAPLFHKVNVGGTRTLLKAAQQNGVRAFVYTSSASVIMGKEWTLINADERWPIQTGKDSPELYSRTKALAEQAVLAANRNPAQFLTCAIRPSAVFGEGDVQTTPSMLRASRRGQSKFQLGNNENLFDWTYVENVAHAHLLAVAALLRTSKMSTVPLDNERVDGEAFFITNDSPIPFWDFARMVWREGGDTAGMDLGKVWVLPAGFALTISTILESLLGLFGKKPNLQTSAVRFSTIARYYNISKAKSRLGYEPIVSLEEGIKRAVRHCIASGMLDEPQQADMKKRQPMFRNPRENRDLPADRQIACSTGRPPSPPSAFGEQKASTRKGALNGFKHQAEHVAAKNSHIMLKPNSVGKLNGKKPLPGSSKPRPNGSILNFFKKAEKPDDSLFVGVGQVPDQVQNEEESVRDELYSEDYRHNENSSPVKRRRTGDYSIKDSVVEVSSLKGECTPPPPEPMAEKIDEDALTAGETRKRNGPFLDDSESETEAPRIDELAESGYQKTPPEKMIDGIFGRKTSQSAMELQDRVYPPPLSKENTGCSGLDDSELFDNLEDPEDDFPEEGEEAQERRWAREQRKLELSDGLFEGELNDLDVEDLGNYDDDDGPEDALEEESCAGTEEQSRNCPLCNISLAGINDNDASVHVNNCLDGNPTPLPEQNPPTPKPKLAASPKFKRNGAMARPPKPGQQNPFSLIPASKESSSAFTKLMSNHAEDLAWKSAAASESAARGKPSYQRTCPFYKILPGFSICVDAFRYGAVQGCEAYFLSHFHSDHYIGLTSTWCHGPIYCSRVTANLVKQQLRVDPKYVVALEWETEFEVPETNGVHVTMISANHCPGSSLFLFEKIIRQGPNPKKQRILHCGDFRACRAHIEHPLLRPDVLDVVSGKTKDQKIDVCYLDTTYLNPKYAFPSQEEVIKACADMCVSLSNEFKDELDSYETMKRERAGSGMVQFLQNGDVETKIKKEDADPTDGRPANAARGRLLVVVGTYSIGKERICLGIARALNSKIYAPASKQRICQALEDPELVERLTSDPREAQVHMTPLFEIRAETLDEYLKDYRDAFSRAVGFRPSGWNYRPPNSRFVESPNVQTVLYGSNWKSGYSMRQLTPQRGSTKRAACFGVPYSEHSSFRELTMFCCALRIDKIIPTVNVGSAKSRDRMRQWIDRWAVERKKAGLFKPEHF